MAELIKKLKKRWGIETGWQLVLILFIFSITGITTLYVREFLFQLFGITPDTSRWIRLLAWLLVVFPAYQILFLMYGFILGQFEFVWRFEKKSLRKIKNLFVNNESG